MRSYGQYCSVAKALDVIGDRWTLLVVRELLLQGGCRHADLMTGLPGIATNLLSDRRRRVPQSLGGVPRLRAPRGHGTCWTTGRHRDPNRGSAHVHRTDGG